MSEVKIQHDPRNDGTHTLTIKLVAWELSKIRGLLANLTVVPFGRDISRAINDKLAGALNPHPAHEVTIHRDDAGLVTCRREGSGWVIGECELDHVVMTYDDGKGEA